MTHEEELEKKITFLEGQIKEQDAENEALRSKLSLSEIYLE